MNPEEVVSFIHSYLVLLSYTHENCLDIYDPAVKGGCEEVAKGASTWGTLLQTYSAILPSTLQVKSLQSVLEYFTLNDTEPVLVQRMIRTFVGEEALQFGLLASDDRQGNVLSIFRNG